MTPTTYTGFDTWTAKAADMRENIRLYVSALGRHALPVHLPIEVFCDWPVQIHRAVCIQRVAASLLRIVGQIRYEKNVGK